jgi:predicted RNase H-like HicB family nuclease
MQLTAIYRKVREGYVAYVAELPGANTQGATLDETRANLREAAEMVLVHRAPEYGAINDETDVIRESLDVGA